MRKRFLVIAACGPMLVASQAFGQATRTWVSGVGDDANPCSRTAPCKTFAGAISKTAASGEINALDSAGFGAVTITKSITIRTDGVTGGILQAATTGVIVNAGATDRVVLKGLDFEGIGTGIDGIRFLAGGLLVVEDCEINNVTQQGIDFVPTAATLSTLNVKNTIIRNAALGAILIKPGTGGAKAIIDNLHTERGQFGIRAEAGADVVIRNSVLAEHSGNGALVFSNGAAAKMFLESTTSAYNTQAGLKSEGTGASAFISNVTVTGNAQGFQEASSGKIFTFGNNKDLGNTSSSTTLQPVTPQK